MKTIEIRCDFCGRLINNYYRLRLWNFLKSLLSLWKDKLNIKYIEKWEGTRYKLDICPQCFDTTKTVLRDRNTINELRDLCIQRQNAGHAPTPRVMDRIDWGGTQTGRTYTADAARAEAEEPWGAGR